MLEVRAAKKSISSINPWQLIAIWFVISAVLLFLFDSFPFIILAQFLAVSTYLISWSAKNKKIRLAEEKEYGSSGGLVCKNCSIYIKLPLKTQNTNGEPILFHCEKCEILWFTGLADNGD